MRGIEEGQLAGPEASPADFDVYNESDSASHQIALEFDAWVTRKRHGEWWAEVIKTLPMDRVVVDVVNSYRSALALGSALNPVEEPVSPQMARSVQASINRWRHVMKDYRFLTSTEAGELLGSRSGNRSLASHRRSKGEVLGVKHGNAFLYPEFQFDGTGDICPVIPRLITLADEHDWSEQGLILWLVTPTGYFDDEPPVKHLDDPDRIMAGARSRFEPAW
ncbi:hypothetical protein [Arthrobacter flavus]|uniref:Antitoxin Xre/MbcA/ParS-like toxin-binding domain-containing protein n=1 Tax=Arthrobacter flavus TaxID=95172 RepID=A0ABW4Q9X0_9MICC